MLEKISQNFSRICRFANFFQKFNWIFSRTGLKSEVWYYSDPNQAKPLQQIARINL